MKMESADVARAGWALCEVGCSDGRDLYWRPDYNSPHRGFILSDACGFEGVVCEQGCSPWSREGVRARFPMRARTLGEAVAELDAFCTANGHAISG